MDCYRMGGHYPKVEPLIPESFLCQPPARRGATSWGLGFRDLGFRGLGFRDLGFRIWGLGFWGLGIRV